MSYLILPYLLYLILPMYFLFVYPKELSILSSEGELSDLLVAK